MEPSFIPDPDPTYNKEEIEGVFNKQELAVDVALDAQKDAISDLAKFSQNNWDEEF